MIEHIRNISLFLFFMLGATCLAQSPDLLGPSGNSPSPAPQPTRTTSSSPTFSSPATSQGLGLGEDIPFVDMATGTVSWDGKLWNIDNNRLFRSQFERYLNTPAEGLVADQGYREIMDKMISILSARRVSMRNLDEAVDLLPQASAYDIDANLCDALASNIYNVWQAKNEQSRLIRSNRRLEKQKDLADWNAEASVSSSKLSQPPPKNANAAQIWKEEQKLRRDLILTPYVERAAELRAMILANRTKKELSEVQAKINFQILITQFFFQRRFEHVLLGIRFYQSLFQDGDMQLKVGGELEKTFTETSGSPPTLAVIESMAKQAIRDVEEGVEAFHFLLEKQELNSATERLQEAFAVGQYLPPIRSLKREDKRKVLDFQQKRNQLLSALEVRDYTLAESLINELKEIAHDFDASKAEAMVQTAKTVSSMHLVKARTAATSGDKVTLENELKAAAEIWPRNPQLSEFTKTIFTQADAQQKAIAELDRLIQTKNYREIYKNQVRYIAAAALYPDKQEDLKSVLEEMHALEGTMMRARELSNRGDHAGGWECLEMVIDRFDYDSQINQLRAELTTRASEFVRRLRQAEELEEKGQLGSSLAWYLNAQDAYPMSTLAKEGVERVVKDLVPQGPEFDNPSASLD